MSVRFVHILKWLSKRLCLCELQKVKIPQTTTKKKPRTKNNKNKQGKMQKQQQQQQPPATKKNIREKWRKQHAVNSIRNTHGQTTSTLHTSSHSVWP